MSPLFARFPSCHSIKKDLFHLKPNRIRRNAWDFDHFLHFFFTGNIFWRGRDSSDEGECKKERQGQGRKQRNVLVTYVDFSTHHMLVRLFCSVPIKSPPSPFIYGSDCDLFRLFPLFLSLHFWKNVSGVGWGTQNCEGKKNTAIHIHFTSQFWLQLVKKKITARIHTIQQFPASVGMRWVCHK